MKEIGVWVEVTTLIIPGLNDDDQELRDITRFLKDIDPDIPWHVTQFYPTYKLMDRPRTPVATLHRARNIGIAMGLRGTDVAKGASDMILTDDNFASIIGAVEEGRRQFDNIQKFVRYLLSSNMGEVLAIFVNILLGGPLILLPVQILWMNLVTDGMTAVALGLEPAEKGIMQYPPRAAKEPILNRAGIFMILLLGGYIGVATLWLFHHYLAGGRGEAVLLAQTVAFTGIIVLEKMNVFNYRALRAPLSTIGFFSNPWVLLAWTFTIGLQVCAVYVPFLQKALHTVPLGLADWGLIFMVALPIFVMAEAYKWLWRWRTRRNTMALSEI